jgi:uncharacterized membrane protein YkoI
MKIMKKKMLTFGLIGLVSLGTTVGAFASTNNQGTTGDTNKTAIEQADDKEVNDDASIINANVKLTEAEAATIALSSVDPNAKVVKVELQDENGTFAYGIDMIVNNKKLEVNVDANSGQIVASDNNQENNDNDQEINDDNQAVNNNTDDQEIND